jgi:hypothetical protein
LGNPCEHGERNRKKGSDVCNKRRSQLTPYHAAAFWRRNAAVAKAATATSARDDWSRNGQTVDGLDVTMSRRLTGFRCSS